MFGYIKPAHGELRVRESELYRAAYCGLCRSMGKCTGCASRMTLSYDFVFLALVRYVLSGESVKIAAGRCVAHPLKKRPYLCDSESLRFTAGAAAVLFCEKNEDDIRDERGFRRLFSLVISPAARHAAKRAGMDALRAAVETGLERLSALEREKCSEIDTVADVFGDILAALASYGLEGSASRIASEIGRYTGRFIYICDAADDIGDDIKLGRYNPFALAYGNDCAEEREVWDHGGHKTKRVVLKREIADSLYTAALLDLKKLGDAEALLDYGDAPESRLLRGIIGNMIGIGMPGEMMWVLGMVSSPTFL